MKVYKQLIFFIIFLSSICLAILVIVWSNTRSGVERCIEDVRFRKEIEADVSTYEDRRVMPWLNVFFGKGDLYHVEGIYYYPGEEYYLYEDVIESLEKDEMNQFSGAEVDTTKSMHIGSKEARLVVVIFTDYRTNSYKNFVQNIFPVLNERYIKEGKVRIVFKDITLEKDSMEISNTLRCKASHANDPADVVK